MEFCRQRHGHATRVGDEDLCDGRKPATNNGSRQDDAEGLGLFNPMMREMVEMHYLQTDPVLMDDSRLEKLLGGLKYTSYDQGIQLTLIAMAKG